jgi:LysM repeat protein
MHKRIVLLFSLCGVVLAGYSQKKKTTVHEYIETYQELAVSEMERTGIPASITLAQGILESANGNSRLSTKGNNHFGIKCKKNWTGNTIYADDDELNECFRAYKSAKDSYIDHSAFLMENSRYAFLFDLKPDDYKGWARGLKKAGYATNPKYADILIVLIERHELNKLDKKERIKKKKKKKEIPVSRPDPILKKKGELFKFNGIPATMVMEGQSAVSISTTFGLRPKQFYRYNDLKAGSDVVPGSIVYLKPKRRKAKEAYHIVTAGQTMYAISQQFGIKLKHLYKKNRMKPGQEPAIGQTIYLRRKRRRAPELRDPSKETKVAIPTADAVKKEPYSEKPMVTIVPGENEKYETPKKENKTEPVDLIEVDPKSEYKVEKPKKEEKKEESKDVFVEKDGDEKYNVEIENKNKETNYNKMQLDDVQYHEVQKGETLFAISRKYGKSVQLIKELNDLKDYNLSVGQKLIINQNFKEPTLDTENTNFYHEVQKGESLYKIAKLYNMSVDALKKLNNISNDALNIGQKLLVSKAAKTTQNNTEKVTTNVVYHTVEKGDTLYSISRKYNVKVDAIKELNKLSDNTLSVGQKLRIK